MGKRICTVAVVIALVLSMSACGSIFDADYSYSQPYTEGLQDDSALTGIDIKNYAQLKNVLNSMVLGMTSGGELRFNNYDGSVSDDIAAACYEIKSQTPMGAYAVDSLTYNLSRIVSYYTAEVSIVYRRSRDEMSAVDTVNGVSALRSFVRDRICEYSAGFTFRIYSSIVNEQYLEKLIEDIYFSEPFMPMPEPEVSIEGFPNEGVNRIYQVGLTYDGDAELFAERKEVLAERAETICESIEEGDAKAGAIALRCAEYIDSQCMQIEADSTQGDTAYDVIVDGQGNSKGIALAYMSLCSNLGIECVTVRGSLGTLGTEPHYWNIITIDGDHYHVDVSRMRSAGGENAFLISDEDAWGTYMWDHENYPECIGKLSYYDFAEVPATVDNTEPQPDVPGETEGNTGGQLSPSEDQLADPSGVEQLR